jgi:uncharacterized membrane protein YeiH
MFVALHYLGLGRQIAVMSAVATGFALRAGALLWGWSLPRYRARPPHDK